jgi:DNA-binding NarL/FixJ family response regulator
VNAVNVLIVENNPVDALGVCSFLRGSRFRVSGNVFSVAGAVEHLLEREPELVVSELVIADLDTLPILEATRAAGLSTKIMYFTALNNPVLLNQAKLAGAAGVVQKDMGRVELLNNIEKVCSTGSCWTRAISRKITGAMSASRVDMKTETAITNRELEVLRQICGGNSNQKIAKNLGISFETVKEHVQNLLRKLQVADRTQAAVWAVRNQLA